MLDFKGLFQTKLGFGCMRLPQLKNGDVDKEHMKRMVDYYLEQGGKYFDTAYPYHDGKSEEVLGVCLTDRHPRESFYIADKMPMWMIQKKEQMEDIFKEQCRRCHVNYFDFYLLHNLNTTCIDNVETVGAFEYLEQLKKEGRAKYIGFSFHDTAPLLEEILKNHPKVDFVQLQINYFDWDSATIQSRACYEVAKKYQIPVIVMETVHGGGLANLPEKAAAVLKKLDPKASAASYAVRFAASLDQVAITLSGMSSYEQMTDNCSYMAGGKFQPLKTEEKQAIDKVVEILKDVHTIPCTGCRYCVDECPKKIQIPNIFSIYNDKQMFGEVNFPGMHYAVHTEGKGKASDCIKCGKCEAHCPQHLSIREHLVQVSEVFW
jgi:predicted aldo/keto reductase-like oxidoreductase